MKYFYLSLLCLWCFATTANAQPTHQIWKEMEEYVQKQMEIPIPNEEERLKSALENALAEDEKIIETEILRLQLRRTYWELEFVRMHPEAIAEAKEEYRKIPVPIIPVPNPPLIDTCVYHIAVILDRSGSIQEPERVELQNNLDTFINELVGTDFTLTLIGMSTPNGTAVTSTTLPYSPGDPATHQGWLDNNFATTSGSRGSWRSGLEAAATLEQRPDLVLIISDGTAGGNADRIAAAQWADVLKAEGSHLFSLSQGGNIYDGVTYLAQVMAVIDPNPLLATAPALFSNIQISDYASLEANQFLTTSGWLDALSGAGGRVDIGWVADTACVVHNMVIAGTYDTCSQTSPPVGLAVEFWQDDVFTGVSIDADLRPDQTWHYSNLMRRVVEMGLEFGMSYDIYPILTLANGATIRGTDYEPGLNNDLFIAPRSNATVVVNNRIDNPNLSLSQLCATGPLYYHGSDPLTPNHHSAIHRRPTGSTQAFGDYRQFGWVGTTLDGYTGDLNVQYPGYFEPGYEYLLTISTNNIPDCITWTPVEVIFEIIDCCAPDFTIGELPNCVTTGNEFVLCIDIEAPILVEDIEAIYEANNDYDITVLQIIQAEESLQVCINVIAKNDNCSGTPLILDIAQQDCSNTIWVMTEPLLSCVGPCQFMKITDWQASPCRWLEDQIARDFCIDFFSAAPVSELFAGGNLSTCQVDLQQIEVSDLGEDSYQVCGTMVFEDPECTGHAEVTLNFSIGDKCCNLEQNFSFPNGCDSFDLCLFEDPVIDLFDRQTSDEQLYIITDLPVGTSIQFNDLINGTGQSYTIEMIPCQWEVELDLDITSNGTCPGFIVPVNTEVNCNPILQETPEVIYHYEIRANNCGWELKGNYCDLLIAEPSIISPEEGGGGETPLGENRGRAATPLVDGPSVYPNPAQEETWLQFDLGPQADDFSKILISNMQGQSIAQFPTQARRQFAFPLPKHCPAGLYLVSFIDHRGQVQTHQQLVVLP